MLTARGEEADRIVGLELGADDYVTKPFSPRELAARVRTRAPSRARRDVAADERLAFGDVELDAQHARGAQGRQSSVRLTAKEFDLLWFLASHPRRVFSRDQLMSRVWGYEAALDTGTVTVHVRRLREKIEDDPSAAAPPPDGLGRRLPVRRRDRVAIARRARRRSPSASSLALAAAPAADPPPAARRARASSRLPPARRGARSPAGSCSTWATT